jgi:hypothetical protein
MDRLDDAAIRTCGLMQMYASRYGSLPVARKTGGLHFEETTSSALVAAIDHALTLYRRPLKWRRLPLQTMSHDFSWGASAAKYVGLYRQMLGFRVLPEPLPHQAVEGTSENSPRPDMSSHGAGVRGGAHDS